MSDDLYRVLYIDADGDEQLTAAMTYGAAQSRARDLDGRGYAVGSVMGASAAEAYMRDRYSPTYRGVKVPDDLRADGAPRSGYEAWKRGVDVTLDGPKEKPVAPADYNHELRARALSLPETVLRRAVDRLLEQCGKEEAYPVPSDPRSGMLYASEVYRLLGLRQGPGYSALEREIRGES